MSSGLSVRRGCQFPRLSSSPGSVLSSEGDDAVELARTAGLVLDPWQEHVLRVGLGQDAAGLWSAFEVGCVVPRQNGKGAVIEALCLAALFLSEERLTIYSAHEFKTAQETYRRIKELILNTDFLRKQVKRNVQSTNESGFELFGDRRLRCGDHRRLDELLFSRFHQSGRRALGRDLQSAEVDQVWPQNRDRHITLNLGAIPGGLADPLAVDLLLKHN